MKGGWVYFMSNRRNGTLYVGVTANLSARVFQHREGRIEGFLLPQNAHSQSVAGCCRICPR